MRKSQQGKKNLIIDAYDGEILSYDKVNFIVDEYDGEILTHRRCKVTMKNLQTEKLSHITRKLQRGLVKTKLFLMKKGSLVTKRWQMIEIMMMMRNI